ncbi:MAG TPA: tetratricopeptide repeat protein, partial [Nitrospiria bacterium]
KGMWGRTLVPVILTLATFLWVDQHSVSIRNWIDWNYSGFENKRNWPAFSGINRQIAGGVGDPRVVYEHNDAHNDMGTLRAFESIPLFSGRSTLEGLYMQSSISTPFIFYIQSEISKQISCPLPDYGCAVLNLKNGIEHLKLFNVREFIVRSPEVKREIAKFPEFKFVDTFGPLDLYELTSNENRYVSPLNVEPVLYETHDWKTASYQWFKKLEVIDIPLVFTEAAVPADGTRFKTIVRDEDVNRLPRIPIAGSCRVEEKVEEETIRFKTSCLNRPHLIKISYHPNWKVEGAARVYLASPSFMLVYPDRGEVTLRFSRTGVEYTGIFLSLMALTVVGLNGPYLRNNPFNRFILRSGEAAEEAVRAALNRIPLFVRAGRYAVGHRRRILTAMMTALVLLMAAFVVLYKKTDPGMLYNEGLHEFNKQNYVEARRSFEKVVQDYPLTASAVNSAYYWAITYFREGDYAKTIGLFEKLLLLYPESPWVPEAHYHIAISLANLGRTEEARGRYLRVVERYPASQWSGFARERLTELAAHKPGPEEGADRLFTQAMGLFDSGALDEAGEKFRAVVKRYPKSKLAENSGYFVGICYFKQDRFKDVIREFQTFVADHPRSDYAAEAYFHIGLSHQRLNQNAKARAVFEKIIRDYPASSWAGYSRDALKAAGFKPA